MTSPENFTGWVPPRCVRFPARASAAGAITPDVAAAYAASRLETVAKGLEWADCPLQAGMVRQLAEQLTTFAREVSSAL